MNVFFDIIFVWCGGGALQKYTLRLRRGTSSKEGHGWGWGVNIHRFWFPTNLFKLLQKGETVPSYKKSVNNCDH